MDKSTHQIRCERWMNIITECQQSGMTKKAWCQMHGVNEKTMYYWQRILRNEAYISKIESENSLPAVVSGQPPAPALVEIKPLPETESHCFCPDVIIRKGEVSVEIANSASPELLSRLGGILNAQ